MTIDESLRVMLLVDILANDLTNALNGTAVLVNILVNCRVELLLTGVNEMFIPLATCLPVIVLRGELSKLVKFLPTVFDALLVTTN